MLFITVISCVQWASECVWGSKLIIDPWCTCAVRLQYLVCVSVCVCVSVTQRLTFHVIIHATNDTNLLRGG